MTEKRDWTTDELRKLEKMGSMGARALAEELHRSVKSVQSAAHRYRKSLRGKGERRGVRLGQPRGASWKKDLSRLGVSDDELPNLEERIRRSLKPDGPLCTDCVEREVAVRSTGLCLPCHFRRLAQAKREKEIDRKARAEYLKESKKALRRTVCLGCGAEFSPRLDREGRKSDRNLCPECRKAQ